MSAPTNTTEKACCGRCGTTINIWFTCVGQRCGACGCEAEKHGPHEYDYEFNSTTAGQ